MIRKLGPAALALLLTSAAFAAPPEPGAVLPPDLSEAAIDSASFPEWQARLKAAEDAAAAEVEAAEAADDAEPPIPEAVDEAEVATDEKPDAAEAPDPFLIRMQVLLDRAHVSPGVIDGLAGGNTEKAIRAYETMRDLKADGVPDADFWDILATDGGKAMKVYTISEEDIGGRYVDTIPEDYAELAAMDWLGYRDPVEMLAERFHMDEDLLRALNPDADFGKAGTEILVADPGAAPETKVLKIVVDKDKGELRAYDEKDELVLIDPATIGSSDTPSPTGTVKVNGSAPDPTYSYNPDKNFKQGDNAEKLTIPAGPNGPVGSMWIDLSKPTYGIHGTPEPSKIDKTASHGCVRLTNWDAAALAKLVKPGETVVEFRG